ncbi:MAG: hypothetical protein AB8B50_02860 [Pirellulaceae bacterium]
MSAERSAEDASGLAGNGPDDPRKLGPPLLGSICLSCKHRRLVESGKGSVFLMCGVGLKNRQWPKYPPQPLSKCPHHAVSESED